MDYKEIFSIILLSSLGEIERPRDDRLPVNNHQLIMGNGVLGFYFDRDPLVIDKSG